jgi:recombination protein RecR
MLSGYPEKVQTLIAALTKLPGIGRRSAERIALYLLKTKAQEVFELSDLIRKAKEEIRFCQLCGNFSRDAECSICQDNQRDVTTVCVVQEPRDISRVERSGRFHGVYHVLFGVISPLDGIGPADLRIAELEKRIKAHGINEIILATPTNTEGETAASYLAEHFKPLGVRISRLARGLPYGSSLEFADEETLASAIEHRQIV